MHARTGLARWIVGFAAIATATPAVAADFEAEGWYRGRLRAFDSLSLNNFAGTTEGASAYMQHRFWLRPRFIPNDKVGVFLELRGLDNLTWGNQPDGWIDPTTGSSIPAYWVDGLNPPTSSAASGENTTPLVDISLWRVWSDVQTPVGRFSFGRMPLHWGTGIWQNDGLGLNAEYGDTADRVQWEHKIEDVYARVAVDVNAVGVLNDTDDTFSVNAMAAYRTEIGEVGVNGQMRVSPPAGSSTTARGFTLGTISVAGSADMGPVSAKAEVIGQFGGGNLPDGFNDARVLAFGGVADVALDLPQVQIGITGGFATGDSNDSDRRLKTFTFDRDYNLGLLMFEQPMPLLPAAAATEDNGGRDYSAVQSGIAVSNAVFIKAAASRVIDEKYVVGASALGANTARVPDRFGTRSGYGWEFGVNAGYKGIENFDLIANGALMLPGSWYSDFSTDTVPSFGRRVLGAQVIGRVRF